LPLNNWQQTDTQSSRLKAELCFVKTPKLSRANISLSLNILTGTIIGTFLTTL
jgi:hypothetical protein